MSCVADLVQTNFQLTAELRKVRNELATVKAIKLFEDSEDVARIKEAYNQLESEVVTLRKQAPFPTIVELPWTDDSEDSHQVVLTQLTDSLRREKEKYEVLEKKYNALRKDLSSVAYSEPSTTSSSPMSYQLSMETLSQIVVKPELEPMFSQPKNTRRTAICPAPINVVNAIQPKRNSRDPSVQRLAKIARFRS